MKEKVVKLRIYGMSCDDCVVTVARGLMEQPGVLDAKVSLKEGTGKVKIDPEAVRPEDLLKNKVFSGSSHYKATLME